MKALWQGLMSRLGFGRAGRRGFLGSRLEEARGSEFFCWFSFAEAGAAKDEGGNTVISFRPEGEKFHDLVKLEAALDEGNRIARLSLSLSRSFVDHERDGIFARDISKSFLRSALPQTEGGSITALADEIEWRHDFPVITRSSARPQLPPQPSAGFLTYIGRRELFEEVHSEGIYRIEQRRTQGGEAVVLTVRAGP